MIQPGLKWCCFAQNQAVYYWCRKVLRWNMLGESQRTIHPLESKSLNQDKTGKQTPISMTTVLRYLHHRFPTNPPSLVLLRLHLVHNRRAQTQPSSTRVQRLEPLHPVDDRLVFFHFHVPVQLYSLVLNFNTNIHIHGLPITILVLLTSVDHFPESFKCHLVEHGRCELILWLEFFLLHEDEGADPLSNDIHG